MNTFLVGAAVAALVGGPPVAPRFEAYHRGVADNTPAPSAGYALTHRASAIDPSGTGVPELRFPYSAADQPTRLNPVFPETRVLSFGGPDFNPWGGVGVEQYFRRSGPGGTSDAIGTSPDCPSLQLAARLARPTAERTEPVPAPDVTAELVRVVKERAKVFAFHDDGLHRLMLECEASGFPDSVDCGRWLRSQGLK